MLCTGFSCLGVLARASSTVMKSSGKSGYPCHFSHFRVKVFSLLPFSVVLAIGFIVDVPYQVEEALLYSLLAESFSC